MTKDNKNIVIAWYRADQWKQLIEISEDSADLETSYEEWSQQAEKAIEEMKKTGLIPVKIDVEVAALKKWCKEEDKPINARTRTNYALFSAQKGKNILI